MTIVRCPDCRTAFRVRPEQLEAHGGLVRCGRCHTAFDALVNRVAPDRDAGSTEPRGQPRAAPTAFGGADRPADASANPPAPAPDAPFFILDEGSPDAERQTSVGRDDALNAETVVQLDSEPTPTSGLAPTSPGDSLDFEIPHSFHPGRWPAVSEPTGSQEQEVPPAWVSPPHSEPDADPTDASASLEHQAADEPGLAPGEDNADRGYESGDAYHGSARADTFDERLAAIRQRRAEQWGHGTRVEPVTRETNAEIGPTAEDRTEDDEADIAAPFQERIAPAPERRWLWGVLVGLLTGILAVQATYVFRAEIARTWPTLRPMLLEACSRLGCTIELPRVAGAIVIEGSALQSDPAAPARFVLSVVVRNTARFPQALPHLELTLTGARDRPLVRRVLSPDEWLPPRAEGVERFGSDAVGFSASASIAAEIGFEAPGLEGAAGYRVYAFYP